ncbi:hypothetical protein B0E38_02631 [Streptomyces sp. 111WW2]|uniref:hypothetical protein n=1 Tax=Streptomyces sp. 111WW2 TaxID=1945515 RepID=UPI000D0C894E|nr:hypothetical protein [Streptomyces sp. 111WW2]PSK57100.1 hypothetical protein B0E38_02631 [Streptomyces sp. 111WW2]
MLTDIHTLIGRVPVYAWAALLTLLFLGAITFGYRAAKNRTRKTPDKTKRRTLIGILGMSLVVTAGLALSTNTSARFAEKRLHMDAPWHMTIGLALEIIVLGLSVYSWAVNDKGAARVVYALVFAQAIGAIEVTRFEGEDLGTALVRIVGPVMLAYGLHKLLGLEAKLGRIEIKSDGILARWWRDRLKRLESRLGIGSRGADAQAISRRNAQDKLITLATLGKPWWAIGKLGTRRYEKALMRAGDASFHGLDDTLEQLGTEMTITTRIDRMSAFKALPDRTADYTLRSLRPTNGPQGAPDAAPDDISALTSEGAAGRTQGPDTGATEATPGEAQASSRRDGGDTDRRRLAFDLYFDLRGTGPAPSQNKFEEAWRKAGYGMKTDDIRALYKEIHTKVTGSNS